MHATAQAIAAALNVIRMNTSPVPPSANDSAIPAAGYCGTNEKAGNPSYGCRPLVKTWR
jgi:hypothetical protein